MITSVDRNAQMSRQSRRGERAQACLSASLQDLLPRLKRGARPAARDAAKALEFWLSLPYRRQRPSEDMRDLAIELLILGTEHPRRYDGLLQIVVENTDLRSLGGMMALDRFLQAMTGEHDYFLDRHEGWPSVKRMLPGLCQEASMTPAALIEAAVRQIQEPGIVSDATQMDLFGSPMAA